MNNLAKFTLALLVLWVVCVWFAVIHLDVWSALMGVMLGALIEASLWNPQKGDDALQRDALEKVLGLLERSGHDFECKSLKRHQECDCHRSALPLLREAKRVRNGV